MLDLQLFIGLGAAVCAGRGPLEESIYVQGHRPVRLPLLTPSTADQQRGYCGHLGLGRGQRVPGAGFVARAPLEGLVEFYYIVYLQHIYIYIHIQ